MIILIMFSLFLFSCAGEQLKITEQPKISEEKNRYAVIQAEPRVVFSEISAIDGSSTMWPSIVLLSKEGDIYEDDNIRIWNSKDDSSKEASLGLGPSFRFNRMQHKIEDEKSWFKKSSVKLSYKGNKIKVDRRYGLDEQFSENVTINFHRDFFHCQLSVAEGLVCYVDCDEKNINLCPSVKVWHEPNNPIIEINNTSSPGMYVMTKNGQLIFIERQFRKITPAQIIHKDIKFLPNKDGRYFINSNTSDICMQSTELEIYCLNNSILDNGAGRYGSVSDDQPNLKKFIRANFPAEEVSFYAAHYCILSDQGEVWCGGDNSCGQITGRYDGIQKFKEPSKIEFLLGPAKQLYTYSGGTCVLLSDGRVQCFGLGASVLRRRLHEEGYYYDSFAWPLGFRPWQICLGGAENGV